MEGIVINDYYFTTPMCMGIAIIGLIFVSFISFRKSTGMFTNMNIWVFYALLVILVYPFFISVVSIGSLLGYLSVTLLKILMYVLLAVPVILAIYLYYNKKKKVVK
ncbi:hypothetical protein EOM09_07625 [bacterium]|nr:hypothetical protein [bacterium]